MTTIAEVVLPPQPIIAIRHEHVNVKALPEQIGQGFGSLAAYIAEKDGVVAEVPYVVFYCLDDDAKLDDNDLTIEVTFPLQTAIPSTDRFVCRDHPGGTAAQVKYKGAYDEGLTATYIEMIGWIKEEPLCSQ